MDETSFREAGISTEAKPKCPICWQEITHIIKLPCSHEFCFLCAKGAVMRNNKCPMCRTLVPPNFFDTSNHLNADNVNIATFDDNYHWYYEGRNGWWLFDSRASQEIEDQYQAQTTQCEMMIVGRMYVIDLANMVQYRRDTPSRKRKIKRDRAESNTKGIAGLRGNINFV